MIVSLVPSHIYSKPLVPISLPALPKDVIRTQQSPLNYQYAHLISISQPPLLPCCSGFYTVVMIIGVPLMR
jgi:hypothetical protein